MIKEEDMEKWTDTELAIIRTGLIVYFTADVEQQLSNEDLIDFLNIRNLINGEWRKRSMPRLILHKFAL